MQWVERVDIVTCELLSGFQAAYIGSCKHGLRSKLRASKFQKFSGGAHPLDVVRLTMH